MTNFAVLSHPRSGTTYFISKMLKSHPDIKCHDEIFNKKRGKPIHVMLEKQYEVKPYYDEKYGNDQIKFIEEYYEKVRLKTNKKCVGFKMFHSQLSPHIINSYALQNLKIILLRRINLGKAALSWEIATTTKQWDIRNKAEIDPFKIQLPNLRKFINYYNNQLNKSELILLENDIPHLKLNYEDLFQAYTYNKVSAFLGINDFKNKTASTASKLNSVDRYKSIINIKEVQAFLIDLGYDNILSDKL